MPFFDVFFCKRIGGSKLPLRGLAALVSIHTRFSWLFSDMPQLCYMKHLAREAFSRR
ncbi:MULTISPECIES: hypothetical protein [unclassified Serratia (in: enterobacteria)]|uniref:hypothetical protein n=1 Tax=unclassified Serratia (in: enterobacteria) TaxID=2647522 RepID=UPI000A98752A|nr:MULTISPECIES: hypothetical protein [unclassified Serratia (in: enterobacteria)]